jgi:hypothetical protein
MSTLENNSAAVAVLTAWHESDEQKRFLMEVASSYATEDVVGLLDGLIDVGGLLLLRLATATEHSPLDILQDVAERCGE